MPPRVKRPKEPSPGECCGSGCTRCVWDVYYDKLATYEEMKGDGDDSDISTENSSFNTTEDSDECTSNYIGSVVIKYVDSPNISLNSPSLPCGDDGGKGFSRVSSVTLVKCSCEDSNTSSINVISIDCGKPIPEPAPGDVIEVLVPNDSSIDGQIDEICTRLRVNPESWCELRRSPFVPDGHFPPWLPLNRLLTVRHLLTYYVDISSCSYLMHSTFFESLLRIYNNNKGTLSSDTSEFVGTPDLLVQCAHTGTCQLIFRTLMNSGKPKCFTSLIDVLNIFPFVTLPLERLLEISGPLQPRKYSVVGHKSKTAEGFGLVELCLRQVMKLRIATPLSPIEEPASQLANLLNKSAENRNAKYFNGHTSRALCSAARDSRSSGIHANSHNIFISTSQFGRSLFAKEFRRALQTVVHSGTPLLLVGAGTGIAPLIAGIRELSQLREKNSYSSPFVCRVIYGARTKEELVYRNEVLRAVEGGSVMSCQFALSRDHSAWSSSKYVTDLLSPYVSPGYFDGGGRVFVCGPTGLLRSIRSLLESKLLNEPEDDESIRQQRVMMLEEKHQLMFDVWTNNGVL